MLAFVSGAVALLGLCPVVDRSDIPRTEDCRSCQDQPQSPEMDRPSLSWWKALGANGAGLSEVRTCSGWRANQPAGKACAGGSL